MIRDVLQRLHHNSAIQGSIICMFWIASELIVKTMKLPISGGVVGLGIILLLLLTQTIKISSVKKGSQLLLKDILLFFIPPVLALIEHHELMGILGLKILFVIVCSTIMVMLVTAVVVDCCYHWRTAHGTQHAQ